MSIVERKQPERLRVQVPRDLYEGAEATIRQARLRLFELQEPDGHWCAELEGDTILESEYVLLLLFLGGREEKIRKAAEHGINGNIGRSFVRGFGLKRGAIASSVGHDSHNITVVGANDADMAAAVNRLIEMGGGFAVADGGTVTAELALPVAGLMSTEPFEAVEKDLITLRAAAKNLGCVLPEPFLQVAFLALPVIPHLKMTDRGLFDVDKFDFV